MAGNGGETRNGRRRGHTLLELVVASSLLAAVLIPGLRMLRDGLEQSQRIEILQRLTTSCTGKLEEHLCLAGAAWEEETVTGDFASDGYPQTRFRAARSANPVDGGIADQLMAVSVTVWEDLDADAAQDAGEPSVTMASKVPKMALYQDEAGS
jgi:hypothetical protein